MTDLRPLLLPAALLYAILAGCDLAFMDTSWHRYVHALGIIVGCVLAVALSSTGLARGWWRASGFLAGSSFLVYAYHGMPLALMIKVAVRFFRPESEGAVIALYLGSALLVILVGLGLYALMRRYMPTLLSLITGGR